MTQHTFKRSALALAMAATLPLAAQAQSSEPLKFGVALYGWLPAISGSTSLPPNGGGPDIGVSMGDVLDSLKMTFMGTFEVSMGKWGLWTDIVYADFGSNTKTVPVHVGSISGTADVVLDVKSWIWTLAGTYNLTDTPENKTDLLFGTRLLDMSNTLNYNITSNNGGGGTTPTAARRVREGGTGGLPIANPGVASASESNWDAIIGIKGQYRFGDDKRWFVPYLADIGTGESKLTYQGVLGIGYQFGWGSVVAAWRYLSYDFKSSSHISDLSFNGPLAGVAFNF